MCRCRCGRRNYTLLSCHLQFTRRFENAYDHCRLFLCHPRPHFHLSVPESVSVNRPPLGICSRVPLASFRYPDHRLERRLAQRSTVGESGSFVHSNTESLPVSPSVRQAGQRLRKSGSILRSNGVDRRLRSGNEPRRLLAACPQVRWFPYGPCRPTLTIDSEYSNNNR